MKKQKQSSRNIKPYFIDNHNCIKLWLLTGAIYEIWVGNENTYYMDGFGNELYIKR
jgi:hypothetical protein